MSTTKEMDTKRMEVVFMGVGPRITTRGSFFPRVIVMYTIVLFLRSSAISRPCSRWMKTDTMFSAKKSFLVKLTMTTGVSLYCCKLAFVVHDDCISVGIIIYHNCRCILRNSILYLLRKITASAFN